MLRKEMSYRLCIVHNMNKKTCEKRQTLIFMLKNSER